MDTNNTAESPAPSGKTDPPAQQDLLIDALTAGLDRHQALRQQGFRSYGSQLLRAGQSYALVKAWVSSTDSLAGLAGVRRAEVLEALIGDVEYKGAQEEREGLRYDLMQHARAALDVVSGQVSCFRSAKGMQLKTLIARTLEELTLHPEQNEPAALPRRSFLPTCELDKVIKILFASMREKLATPAFLPAISVSHPFEPALQRWPGAKQTVALPSPYPYSADTLVNEIMPDMNVLRTASHIPAAIRAGLPITARIAELANHVARSVASVLQVRHDVLVAVRSGGMSCDLAAAAMQSGDRDRLRQDTRDVLYTIIRAAQELELYAQKVQDLSVKYMEMRGLMRDAAAEYLDTGRPKDGSGGLSPDCFHGAAIVIRAWEILQLVSCMLIAFRGEEAMSDSYAESSYQLNEWLPVAQFHLTTKS